MIAVLADIHANLFALDAVLSNLPTVSQIWVLGDMVGEMPFPSETLDRLLNLNIPILSIAGNQEVTLMKVHQGLYPEWNTSRQFGVFSWTAAQLQPHHWEFIESLQPTKCIENIPGSVLLFHGSPSNVRGMIFTQEDAENAAKNITTRWLAGGHSHRARCFQINGQTIFNADSVGISLSGIGGVAGYALIDETIDLSYPRIMFNHIRYDLESAIKTLRRSEIAELAPGITRAVEKEITTGHHYMTALVRFAENYAEKQLGYTPPVIPPEIWNAAEETWDALEWTEARSL
jgi:predicted phosphodiesterase